MKYLFKRVLSFQIILLLGALILQFLFILFMESKDTYSQIDKDLYNGASAIKYYLGEDYVNMNLSRDSMSREEIYKNASLLHEEAQEKGLDYFYILVRTEDDIVYAAMSDEVEELDELPMGGYWFSMRESEDDSFDETWDAFDSAVPVYVESSDIWGRYRSIYVPEISEDGRLYLAGADITTSSLNKIIIFRALKVSLPFAVSLLIIIPAAFRINKGMAEKKRMEAYIANMEKRDKLTNAYSRRYGLHLLSTYISKYHSSGKIFSICLIDIDNLKFINEHNGMEAGDTLLVVVHRIVSRVFRKSDSLIRLEGNKFMVILPDFNRKSSKDVYTTLEEKIQYFNRMNKRNLFIRLNYTMSEYRSGSMRDFLEKTRENLKIESSDEGWKNRNLQDEILRGISNNEFRAYFQPKVYLKERKVAFEALVRWEHPEKGLIPPNMFIPIAEKSFLINEITKIVLRDSLDLAENLNTFISVNLSLISFENNQFLKDMTDTLSKSDYSDLITFELTESIAIKNINATLNKMNRLKKAGISFAIDDFGTGYSSLPFIEKLPIKEIKIDRSFIENINNSAVNQLVIEFVNKIATLKKFSVVCEGTEEEAQIKKLILLGNFSFQGYYFGKPEPPEDVIIKYNKNMYMNKLKEFI